MKLDLALQLMDKCAEQAQFSVPKQAMMAIRKALEEAQKQSASPTNNESNAIALLEECITNGNIGQESLWAWFNSEHNIIQQTIVDGNSMPC